MKLDLDGFLGICCDYLGGAPSINVLGLNVFDFLFFLVGVLESKY
jgi:hypothetical protein